MSTNYAFIGAGNMAKAMIGGILSSGLAAPTASPQAILLPPSWTH